MERIKNISELRSAIADGRHEFFIKLNNQGSRSPKRIWSGADGEEEHFIIENGRDGAIQELTASEIFNTTFTYIGRAMESGAFYAL